MGIKGDDACEALSTVLMKQHGLYEEDRHTRVHSVQGMH